MSYQVTYTRRLQIPGQSVGRVMEAVHPSAAQFSELIPNGTTDFEINVAITPSNLEAFGLIAEVAMTVKTNSSSTPQETINLTAGEPLLYFKDQPGSTPPFSGNVTSFFITNSSGSDGRLTSISVEKLL